MKHIKQTLSTQIKVLMVLAVFGCSQINAQTHLDLQFIGRYATNTYDAGGTEISVYDASTYRLFSVNGSTGDLDIIDISNPASPAYVMSFDLSTYGASANSVASKNGIIAIGVEAVVKQDPGMVVFIDAQGNYLNSVTVGALPDMLTFSPDGNYVLVANEGEPNSTYTSDPEGSVSVIDVSNGVANATVSTAGFTAFNNVALDPAIRIFGPNATVAQDLEPEYITVSSNSQTAWVTCQENNAWAIIDIPTATVTSLVPMGFKNHNLSGNGMDASDQNSGIVNIANWPVKGMYQPDGISSYEVNGQTYIVSANEGDAREYSALTEAIRLGNSSYVLDATAFTNASTLKNNNNLGRLNVTTKTGDTDNDGDFDEIYCFGGRSFSIWDENGTLVWDSGDQLEQKMNQLLPTYFNVSHTNNPKKNRSDDKGPEPEAIIVVPFCDSVYAFIGLERIGGVVVYNITNPNSPYYVTYVNSRNFNQAPGLNSGGDLGSEGLLYIPANQSPNGKDLIVNSNEISGTIAIFEVIRNIEASAGSVLDLCSKGQATMAATLNYGTGMWTRVQGGGQIANPASPMTTINSIAPGENIFVWTVTDGCLTNMDSVVINRTNTPTGFMVSSVSGTSVTLTWTASADPDSFQIQIAKNCTTPQMSIKVSGNLRSYTINGLMACTDYCFKIRANCVQPNNSVSSTAYSSAITATTGAGSCAIANNVTLTQNAGCNYRIEWTSCGTADKFRVRYRMGANPFVNSTFTTNSYFDMNLAPGSWDFRIQSWCNNAVGNTTAPVNFSIVSCRMAGVSENTVSGMVLFPNPTADRSLLNFSSRTEGAYILTVSDVTGRVLSTATGNASAGDNTAEILMHGNAAGIYIVSLTLNGETSQTKLTVQ
jgi:hypothetical protein